LQFRKENSLEDVTRSEAVPEKRNIHAIPLGASPFRLTRTKKAREQDFDLFVDSMLDKCATHVCRVICKFKSKYINAPFSEEDGLVVRHPTISYVYFQGTRQVCEETPRGIGKDIETQFLANDVITSLP